MLTLPNWANADCPNSKGASTLSTTVACTLFNTRLPISTLLRLITVPTATLPSAIP